jgi:hypothetical protein
VKLIYIDIYCGGYVHLDTVYGTEGIDPMDEGGSLSLSRDTSFISDPSTIITLSISQRNLAKDSARETGRQGERSSERASDSVLGGR